MSKYLLVLLLFHCGLDTPAKPKKMAPRAPFEGVNEAIQPFYDEFMKHCKCIIHDIPAGFKDLSEEKNAAICSYYPNSGIRWITIDLAWWENANMQAREQLVFHELGHCYLRREHDDEEKFHPNFGMIPKSIMYPYTFGHHLYYLMFRDYYIKELLNQLETRDGLQEL